MKDFRKKLHGWFPLCWRDALLTVLILGAAAALCLILRPVSAGDGYVPLLFVLAVLVISLTTDGYFFGILASLAAVIGVNYAFTYPYFALNFTLAGYPLTFVILLSVSIIVCTLTARLKQQEKLRMESEQEKLRANLLRAISHDLRTPLTSIEGSVNAVLENGDVLSAAQTQELLTETRNSARWLIRMVENLLSITRMGADPSGAGIRKEPELVEEVLGEAVGAFRRYYPALKVRVSVPEEPLPVPMDAMLIEQVILNLLENAAQHGGDAVSTVEIRVAAERGRAVFRIRDDGQGIDPARLPRLLEGYLCDMKDPRVADSRRNMGIGLSVCSSIVTAHGGTLTGGNRTDRQGAEFVFFLPLDS